MGEGKLRVKLAAQTVGKALQASEAAQAIDTLGGRLQVRWDDEASATPMGQLAYFSEYLKLVGVFDAWVADCPLAYTSPNAPDTADVLGTWMLSALAGHRRYAHVAALRADVAGAAMLGIKRILSDDALRRGLLAMACEPERARTWMQGHLMACVRPALKTPWVLDVDTTIKTLYGNQGGGQVSYNPHKPGRASHAIHTYWMSPLRLVLDAAVQPGREHSAAHSLPGLVALLEALPADERPYLVRGDCAFGNAPVMDRLEALGQPYLFKLRQSANVKRLVAKQFKYPHWQDAGQGWQGREDTLQLTGWTHARRVVVLRRPIKGEIVLEHVGANQAAGAPTQQVLLFGDDLEYARPWEYAVLVTDTDYPIAALAQLYRNRADCENGFDELKNQWGLSGFSTQDIERCELSARAVALVYNWWSWYARLAHPSARLEAKTSRPLLLAAVGRMTHHAGQTHLVLTSMHAASKGIKTMIANIRAGLAHILANAPQLQARQRLALLIDYILTKIRACQPPPDSLTPSLGVG